MRRSFEDEIRGAFQDLLADGRLSIIESRFDAQVFGNSLVTMRAPELDLRLVNDRGDVYGEVARAGQPGTWYPFQYVLAAIRGARPAEGPSSVSGFSEEVRRSWQDLVNAFRADRWDRTHRNIEDVQREATARFVERANEISERARRGSKR
jgi:hypothetical protein